ncbi:MAG: hypothetical protein OZSIB_2416 [Candidatus Ozemobacter sibiricus]|uniref:Uncharacterized protein n=1 Tax=Candidatus Ozemobacter sibiricus TaxID=2268124 RepID=A0A367ZTK6_9BACT|nr:MAG: hypothetical protein OZSIB_2416 [Candidatus Ozemobacter sibiricus]
MILLGDCLGAASLANPAVREYLRRSKRAMVGGNREEAMEWWRRAQALDPSLAVPTWLSLPSVPAVPSAEDSESMPSRDFLLGLTADRWQPHVRHQFEAYLRRYPDDGAVRERLAMLQLARGDHAGASLTLASHPPPPPPPLTLVELVGRGLFFAGAVFLIWQGWWVFVDWRRRGAFRVERVIDPKRSVEEGRKGFL